MSPHPAQRGGNAKSSKVWAIDRKGNEAALAITSCRLRWPAAQARR
jgi:hypothetical protein